MSVKSGDDAEDHVFRALSDRTRRSLLGLLARESHSVPELTDQFDMSQSAVSQHLKVLRDAELVTERKIGRNRIYELRAEPLLAVQRWLDEHMGFWASRLDNLGEHLRRKHGK